MIASPNNKKKLYCNSFSQFIKLITLAMTDNWKNITILIVEDADTSIMFYKLAFKQTEATVLLATDGEHAVETVKDNPNIDVILMDIRMPKMNGLEATTAIKAINPDIAIIIQTAYVLDYTQEECFEAGCDTFLEKPINLATLISSIDDLIKKK